ncbi:MAG TPA: hypothetical protein P5340_06665 [Defluviicoccus sp.]|nr:hypothetical protein [Defluviicoccus sp.]
MPKKKKTETQEDQSVRFRAEVERLIAAGELNPAEADRNFSTLLDKVSEAKGERP